MTLSAWDRTRLCQALVAWLPGRRWFGAGDRAVERVVVADVTDLGRGLLIVLVDVSLAGETEPRRYQLPIGLSNRRPSDPITELSGLWAGDATDDPELMRHLLGVLAEGRAHGEMRFTAEVPLVSATPARRLTAEQSNTSVVYGDTYVLKFFRRLFPGSHPEVEVGRAARTAPTLAPLLGVVEHGDTTLAVLQGFEAGATSGWDLAGTPGFARRAAGLGEAVAATHTALAEAFGRTTFSRADIRAAVDGMRDRLARTATEARALTPYVGALDALLVEAGRSATPGSVRQRVHGDLHLGQVLATERGWLVIDFEGEPATPISERAAWDSPARDVAGVLRSLDYAAARTADPAWAAAAEREFLAGYARRSGTVLDRALLRACQLDKAIYEVGYETRNRPDWAGIPLRALAGFVAASGRTG